WFFGSGLVRGAYTVRQGTAIGRNGLLRNDRDDEGVWGSGACTVHVAGTVTL
ncbi:MAG: hypothetical protein QOC59_728, partial [Microbacteriaceae bacterium]|nr:hypothetical protein [Microbacteriaceae bacterium]